VGERLAVAPNHRVVIGAVHDIIEAGHASRRHGRQRYGHLAVVYRRSGEDAASRDAAIGDVEMQFVAGPSLRIALGVSLYASGAVLWQIGEHGRETLADLALLGRSHRHWLFPCLDRRGVTGNMSHQLILVARRDDCLMQPCRQRARGEFGKGTRERRLARHRLAAVIRLAMIRIMVVRLSRPSHSPEGQLQGSAPRIRC